MVPKISIPCPRAADLELKREEILRYLGGGRQGIPIPATIQEAIESQAAQARTMVEPRLSFSLVPSADLPFRARCLGEVLRQAEYAAIAVCTIGERLESEVARLFADKEYLKAVILDAAGSALAESLTDAVAESIGRECRKFGFLVSMRYSPGYGDWDLKEQRELFALLDSVAGVSLNESCLMKPLKSVSFACAVGRDLPEVLTHKRKCDLCARQDCKFRSPEGAFHARRE